MRVDQLAPSPGSTKSKRRVGRGIGGKGGKTAGARTKGQQARGRGKVARGFEGGQMPLKQLVPKLKGFNNPFRVEYSPVNLDQLAACGQSGIDPHAVKQFKKGVDSQGAPGFLDLFSGGAFGSLPISAPGIMPYITASIIMQVLGVVIPKLEKLQQEGAVGQRKITQYTRYLA